MWLRIDEGSDVVVSVSQCVRCLRFAGSEPGSWKWAILSLHNALQGSMVCHLSGAAALGALTEKNAGAWLEWYEKDRRGEINRVEQGAPVDGIRQFGFATKADHPPAPRLADASELFRRLENEGRRLETSVGAVVPIDRAEREAFHRLHRLRNSFAHFTPMGWSLELSSLPHFFIPIVGLLEKIAADPYPFRHMSLDQKTSLQRLLADTRATLLNLVE